MTLLTLRTSTCGFLIVALMSGKVLAQELETNFQNLSLGMNRDAMIALLGAQPNSEISSQTLFVPTERLKWVGTGGRIYVGEFAFGLLYRWRKCSPNVSDC